MNKTPRIWIFLAGLLGASAVITGAVSAHAGLSDEARGLIDKAVQYQVWHALALLAVALFSNHITSKILTVTGSLFSLGSLLFCGTLMIKGFFGITLFPMSAPIGGTCLILGWISISLVAIKQIER